MESFFSLRQKNVLDRRRWRSRIESLTTPTPLRRAARADPEGAAADGLPLRLRSTDRFFALGSTADDPSISGGRLSVGWPAG